MLRRPRRRVPSVTAQGVIRLETGFYPNGGLVTADKAEHVEPAHPTRMLPSVIGRAGRVAPVSLILAHR